MISILRTKDDKYMVNVNDVNTKPMTINELFKVMKALEVEMDEIDFAITELVWNDHSIANFGVNRKFLLSR